MGTIVSRTLRVGQEHELLQKLEAAGLTEEDAQRVIDSRGNRIARDLITLIRGGQSSAEEIYELDVDYGGAIGVKKVRFRELAFDHDALDDEVLARMAELNCRQPEEVEARKAIGRYTSDQLQEHPRVGLIGPAVPRSGRLGRSYVIGREDGVDLYWDWAEVRWRRRYRFVVVCE